MRTITERKKKKKKKEKSFFRRPTFPGCPSLKAANGPRFFRLPLYAREKYGHPISGAVVRFAHPERHRAGRWCRAELFSNSAGPSNKEWPYVHTRQVPLLPLEPRRPLNIVRTLYTVPGDDTSQLARRARISSKRGGRRLLSTV